MGKMLLVDKSRLRLQELGLSNPVVLSSRSLGVQRYETRGSNCDGSGESVDPRL